MKSKVLLLVTAMSFYTYSMHQQDQSAKHDYNNVNDQSSTALIMAASEGDVEEVKRLLEAGVDINIRDEDGDTALKAAKIALGYILLNGGKSYGMLDFNRYIIIDKFEQIIKLLEEAGAQE